MNQSLSAPFFITKSNFRTRYNGSVHCPLSVQNYVSIENGPRTKWTFTSLKIEGKKLAYARNYTPKSKKKFERSTINSSRALLLRRYL